MADGEMHMEPAHVAFQGLPFVVAPSSSETVPRLAGMKEKRYKDETEENVEEVPVADRPARRIVKERRSVQECAGSLLSALASLPSSGLGLALSPSPGPGLGCEDSVTSASNVHMEVCQYSQGG